MAKQKPYPWEKLEPSLDGSPFEPDLYSRVCTCAEHWYVAAFSEQSAEAKFKLLAKILFIEFPESNQLVLEDPEAEPYKYKQSMKWAKALDRQHRLEARI